MRIRLPLRFLPSAPRMFCMVGFHLPLISIRELWNHFVGRTAQPNPPGMQTLAARVPVSCHTGQSDSVDPLAATEIQGLTRTEAEELLDWLEANGHTGWEVTVSDAGFAVRRR